MSATTSGTGSNEGQAAAATVHTTTTPAPAAPTPTPADKAKPAETTTARRARLAAELAELDAANPDAEPAKNTHLLVLSNGERVEWPGTVSTHHSTKDGVFEVISVHSLTGDR